MKILLKISGDALSGKKDFGIDTSYVEKIVDIISYIKSKKVSLSIVIGGGNIYRGGDLIKSGINPSDSHNLSMLSTVFNGVVLKDLLINKGIKATVMDPLGINFLTPYNKDDALKLLDAGEVVICVGGTGNPYFTTDTGGVLRALELNCDMMIKATKVDGVYDKDPLKHSDAKMYKTLSYDEAIVKNLKIMDQTALVMARDGNLPITVVNLNKKSSIQSIIDGKNEGTKIS